VLFYLRDRPYAGRGKKGLNLVDEEGMTIPYATPDRGGRREKEEKGKKTSFS